MVAGAESVSARSMTVGDVFTGQSPLHVPRYQRGYAWQASHVNSFISDLAVMLEDPDATHFFGSVVCIGSIEAGSPSQGRQVIDGQQRLATFLLTLSALADAAAEMVEECQGDPDLVERATNLLNEITTELLTSAEATATGVARQAHPRMVLSDVDRALFSAIVMRDDADAEPEPERESHEFLIDARDTLARFVRQHRDGAASLDGRLERLEHFRDVVAHRSHLIFIVSSERSQAYRLFSVLNNRGRILSTADLLRSRTLQLVVDFEAEHEAVARIWDEMFANPAKMIDDFLLAYYPSVTGQRSKKDLYDDIVAQFLPAHGARTTTEARELVRVVRKFHSELNTYIQLRNGEWPYAARRGATGANDWEKSRLNRLIVKLEHTLSLPLLLAAAGGVPEQTFAELVYLLELFAFRYKIICNGHPSPPGRVYNDAAKDIRATSGTYTLLPVRTALRELISGRAGNDLFESQLRSRLQYTNRGQLVNIREFLSIVEDHQGWWERSGRTQANAQPKPSKLKVTDIGGMSLEHIYPQNARDGDRVEELEEVKHSLGNLTFFSADDNTAADDRPFESKRVHNYPQSNVRLTSTLADLQTWELSNVVEREASLVAQALRIFVV